MKYTCLTLGMLFVSVSEVTPLQPMVDIEVLMSLLGTSRNVSKVIESCTFMVDFLRSNYMNY